MVRFIARVDYTKRMQKVKTMQKSTRARLQEHQDAPLLLITSEESLNSLSLYKQKETLSDGSKPCFHGGSGYNLRKESRMSAQHTVFVLSQSGKPLTPTTCARAKKLLKQGQAKPVWNRFSQFGIQMIVETRKEHPKTVLGIDNGTKFEGYSIVSGKENNLAVMWKLPDKKKIIRKLEERRRLRRARRFRTCRRRECKSDNRTRKYFIAPSQKVMVLSRLKAMYELFKCYPIDAVAIEDVRFNHRDKQWGKDFSTIEVGKQHIYNWIRQRAGLQMFSGYDTANCRKRYDYKKSSDKSAEVFNAHCSDALAIATEAYAQEHIKQGKFIVVDDTYRPVRRRLHDSQFSKDHIRHPYSSGNFRGIRKGTMCEHGQIVGGTKTNFWIHNQDNHRIGRTKISWLSHHLKTKGGRQFLSGPSHGVYLPNKK